MVMFLFPNEVKTKVTIDVIRLRSNLTTNETIKSIKKKPFFYTKLLTQFNQSNLGFFNVPPQGLFRKITGT